MSSHLPLFTQKRILQKPILIRLPDGTTKTVTTMGNIKVHPGIILKDVLYVKDFKYSLLSISKFREDNDLVALFTQKGFMVQDPTTKRIVVDGNKESRLLPSRLHKLNAADFLHRSIVFDAFLDNKANESSSVVNHVDRKDLVLLHNRLRHSSLSKMSHLEDVPNNVLNKFICDLCQMAKFHTVPFSISNSRAITPFELIHANLWVLYRKLDTSGAHYFLMILDDHTRSTLVYLLQSKMQVPDFS